MNRFFIGFLTFFSFININIVFGQTKGVSLERAIELALLNNLEYNACKLKVEQSKTLIPTALTIDKATISYSYDSNNIAENNHPLNVYGIEQSFSFPTLYSAQYKVTRSESELANRELEIVEKQLIKDVTHSYYEIQYNMNKLMRYRVLDTIYDKFIQNVEDRFNKGEARSLDLFNARAKHQQIEILLNDITYATRLAYKKLRLLINADTLIVVPLRDLKELTILNEDIDSNPGLKYVKQEVSLQSDMLRVERNKLLPDITLGYYNGSNRFVGSKNYPSYEIGITIPIFFVEQKARINGAKIGIEASRKYAEYYKLSLLLKIDELKSELQKYRGHLEYYYTTGKQMSREIEKEARDGYEKGVIDYYSFVESIQNATLIELEYLDWLFQYNSTVLEINYLILESR
ncbi:MAG: TolC family protein [Rikenellaceae bacterium]|jgi:cobalt-zinc-cadmium resistance protein CzcA|nr:TolC family protein [Bacteroidales bacterium]